MDQGLTCAVLELYGSVEGSLTSACACLVVFQCLEQT